ncbi:general odorant-binding protein 69-like [Culex pipiens pallens]|uniref:general odorant-binding protein 69-like n=1 Tax=Culex pipiens pallens TaxID=42434 RepID=UPI001953EE5D|nr:general odorant-binding protein 69-like [Culex pipiens pallens]
MQTLVTIIAALGSLCLVQGNIVHYIFYKSFPSTLRECAQYNEIPDCTLQRYIADSYPCDEPVKRLIHCTLSGLGAWDDKDGLREHVIRNSFKPTPEDTCYLNRTRECIKNALAPLADDDFHGRAYEIFQCYYRQYGNLIDDDQSVPKDSLELAQLTQLSLIIQNLPRCVLIQYSKGDILDEPHFPELLLLWLIRGGFYDAKQGGIQLANLSSQFGHPELDTPQTEQCIRAAERTVCDEKEAVKAFTIFKLCLKDITPILRLVKDAAKALVGEEKSCGCCKECSYPAVSPVYNRFVR